ncbi:transglycosylase SLT domain-containing protein [Pinirhizobacter sp.]|uniref:transglycosylase SLT domain-containing protein n=1 Tax=Pinirhizobacter sp. TaxID=2950432 RepID=UPI002F3F6268
MTILLLIAVALCIRWVAVRRSPAVWFMACASVFLLGVSICPAADMPASVRIPSDSVRYRMQLERAAGERFGIDAPVARLAGQLHQESGWNPSARSAYAQGLAQFTPPTAAWIPEICPDLGDPDPWDSAWSLRAIACYDHWLHERATGATECDRWAMTLSAYNGGEGARDRERRKAYEARDDPLRWFGQVERYQSRGAAAWRENRTYVRRILLTLEPAYASAGWPGKVACT